MIDWRHAFEVEAHRGDRLLPMEGLRGVAAFLVFLVHFSSLVRDRLAPGAWERALADHLWVTGNTGVDLFFILSGYLIYGSLVRRRPDYRRYAWRRLVRLYPTFLAVFVIYLAASLLMPAESKLPAAWGATGTLIIENLLLLPGVFPVTPIIIVAWSLSYEALFYATVPLFIEAAGLRAMDGRGRALSILLLGVTLTAVFALTGSVHTRMLGFIGGMLLFEWISATSRVPGQSAPCPRPWLDAAVVAATLLVLVVYPRLSGGTGTVLLVTTVFTALCHAAFSRPGALARVLSLAPLRWFGNMSYSFYLLHGLALRTFFYALGKARIWPALDGPHLLVLFGVAFVFATGLCAVLFLAVERPLSLAPHGSADAPARATLR